VEGGPWEGNEGGREAKKRTGLGKPNFISRSSRRGGGKTLRQKRLKKKAHKRNRPRTEKGSAKKTPSPRAHIETGEQQPRWKNKQQKERKNKSHRAEKKRTKENTKQS